MGLWSLLWKYLDRRNEADKAPGALLKLANLPLNIDCPKLHPQIRDSVFSPDNKPGNLKKPEGDLEGHFWSFRPMAKTFCGLTMTDLDGGRDRVGVGGLCLLSSFMCVAVFLIDYTPIVSFIFLSSQSLFSWGWTPPHPLPLPAHSVFSRWHLLPTHLHCVPIMHTDSKSFVWADMHTLKLIKYTHTNLC